MCASTDPGKVPRNWGFYVGDDVKRRRYCKICNVWKPDRTHHCSACNRCVLNMDHHCPWINNCVGFFNRRFFIQLLFYGLICLFIVAVQTFHYIFIDNANAYLDDGFHEKSSFVALEYTYASIVLFLTFVLIFALVPFTKFHLKLISKNSTTIENMDIYNQEYNIYNVGCEDNAKQVGKSVHHPYVCMYMRQYVPTFGGTHAYVYIFLQFAGFRKQHFMLDVPISVHFKQTRGGRGALEN
ncbi:zinc finger protein [Plasmodium ovale wallikeri]|uniref:Palmitoyltransferase n=1 Tax=Plasmodium ovale wallikeri TaxID=864142 RepID=A0A1A8Z4Y6_PLAOA|nr:zinc finger protein [Plasmodium ovale wallikeri]SBT39426.1 zinc finger protein [Plasmodium ovale wallikeri]